ncbi:hypothetical protein TNCV_3601201 [Trichonephila clavipes]|nr:hypothetical protein TNCV_3601201 [Trichonephila clavipes]
MTSLKSQISRFGANGMNALGRQHPPRTSLALLDLLIRTTGTSSSNSTRIQKLQYIRIPNLHNRVLFLSGLERIAILSPKFSQEFFNRSRDKTPSQHGGTLKSRRAASPLGNLVEGDEKWEATDQGPFLLPQNWDGIESNRTDTCMVLKVTC